MTEQAIDPGAIHPGVVQWIQGSQQLGAASPHPKPGVPLVRRGDQYRQKPGSAPVLEQAFRPDVRSMAGNSVANLLVSK
jgi:hypothetical protein